MLQAFLMFNDSYEILLPGAYLNTAHTEEVRKCYPSATEPKDLHSGSFWIRKVAKQ
jgi:hypothetical protein